MNGDSISFRCPPDLKERLEKLAEAEGRTRSNMIGRLLGAAARQAEIELRERLEENS
jgi:predicted transcriptional regulator